MLLSKLSGYIQWSSIYLATAQCSVFTLAEFTISQSYTAETSAAGKGEVASLWAMLKSLSTGAEDAGMQRKMGANFASAGYLFSFSFQKLRGSVSSVMHGLVR